eukprot:CAMPEP_0184865420 /NCGR_PEP_ID=MMETSP0580-20130426/18040_1 /TAXON_ID=1118495 /ORGANISM="Dactyliosolen fragilissimus" /LENGTH=258 /DNA_ID=CAMNT_0027364621 /DNA_START=66 /DNA_END=842 /DNA_ORIENTATION=-
MAKFSCNSSTGISICLTTLLSSILACLLLLPTHANTAILSSSRNLAAFLLTSEKHNDNMQHKKPLYDHKNGPEYYRPGIRESLGGDMAYNEKNLQRSQSTYHTIRNVGGIDCVNDIYARNTIDPSKRFWYIGKVARCNGTVSLHHAVAKQWNLFEEHACRLRPVELGRSFKTNTFQLWVTNKGDSEQDILQGMKNNYNGNDDSKDIHLTQIHRDVIETDAHILQQISLMEVGALPEVVTNRGMGFCITCDDNGNICLP